MYHLRRDRVYGQLRTYLIEYLTKAMKVKMYRELDDEPER